MLRFFCCCCFSGDSSNNEREPLLHPTPQSQQNGPESARKPRSARNDVQTVERTGRLLIRRVNVPELDHRFTDMADTFNEQQERYEAMVQNIRNLQQSSDSTDIDKLSFVACLRKMREEQEASYRVSLKMRGYDFSLNFAPVGLKGVLPSNLRQAQKEVKGISEAVKAIISKGTSLQELIGWLLRSHGQMVEQVKEAAETFQELGRLIENLEENIREVKRAKELSQGYRQQAGEILIGAAEIAGAHL